VAEQKDSHLRLMLLIRKDHLLMKLDSVQDELCSTLDGTPPTTDVVRRIAQPKDSLCASCQTVRCKIGILYDGRSECGEHVLFQHQQDQPKVQSFLVFCIGRLMLYIEKGDRKCAVGIV